MSKIHFTSTTPEWRKWVLSLVSSTGLSDPAQVEILLLSLARLVPFINGAHCES